VQLFLPVHGRQQSRRKDKRGRGGKRPRLWPAAPAKKARAGRRRGNIDIQFTVSSLGKVRRTKERPYKERGEKGLKDNALIAKRLPAGIGPETQEALMDRRRGLVETRRHLEVDRPLLATGCDGGGKGKNPIRECARQGA